MRNGLKHKIEVEKLEKIDKFTITVGDYCK